MYKKAKECVYKENIGSLYDLCHQYNQPFNIKTTFLNCLLLKINNSKAEFLIEDAVYKCDFQSEDYCIYAEKK
jgi:hypothetical protein